MVKSSVLVPDNSVGFWSPLDVASSSAVKQPVHLVEKISESSVVKSNHNIRWARYAAVHDALKAVTKLDEDDSFYLSPEVSARASDILSVIANNLTIEPPKFLPQDGEVAVFTWENLFAKRFLSIDPTEVDLLDVSTESFVKCLHEVPDHAEELAFIIRELGSVINSSNLDKVP